MPLQLLSVWLTPLRSDWHRSGSIAWLTPLRSITLSIHGRGRADFVDFLAMLLMLATFLERADWLHDGGLRGLGCYTW